MAAQYPGLPQEFLTFFRETADLDFFFKTGYLRLHRPTTPSTFTSRLETSHRNVDETLSGAIPIGHNSRGEGIVVLPGRGIYRISENARDHLQHLDAAELVFVAPDLETLLSNGQALGDAAASPRRPWREIRRWRRRTLANAYSSRVFLRQAGFLSFACVVLATLHFGWRGFLLAAVGLVGLHRVASREHGGGEGPYERIMAFVLAGAVTMLLVALAAAVLGGLVWLYLQAGARR